MWSAFGPDAVILYMHMYRVNVTYVHSCKIQVLPNLVSTPDGQWFEAFLMAGQTTLQEQKKERQFHKEGYSYCSCSEGMAQKTGNKNMLWA